MSTFEIGYTPNNLKKLLEDNGLSQVDVYKAIGKSRAAFERYLHESNDPRHSTMKHQDWLKVLEFTQKKDI